jgi:uncharacterized membrane protein HdeD (DUF308 family)
MLKSLSTPMILRGVLAIIVGILALVWPGITVLALVILFAVFAFMDAIFQGARAFSSGRAGPVLGHLLLSLIDIAAGVIAIAWPGPTALVLTIVVGVWAMVAGIYEFAAAFLRSETAGTRALLIITSVISVAFGAIVVDRPVLGAFTIALLFGLFCVSSGVTMIVQGNELRKGGQALPSVLSHAA